MKNQSHKDKLDEHLGMKHKKEKKHEQSMKSRRHESKAMHKKMAMRHSKEDLDKAYAHMKMHGG